MKVLAFDTAANQCAAALWDSGTTLARKAEPMERGHAEALVPMIEALMRESRMAYRDLDRIAVTVGPGTFTGLRIGLATARGLALAAALPVFGVTNFAVLAGATALSATGHLLIALETKRADLYIQSFRDGKAATPPAAILPEDIDRHLPPGPLTLAGDGTARAAEGLLSSGRAIDLADTSPFADPAVIAQLAAAMPVDPDAPPPVPLYLRDPSVGRPKPPIGARR